MTEHSNLSLSLSGPPDSSARYEELIVESRELLLGIAEKLMSGAVRTEVTASDMVQQTLVAAIRDQAAFRGQTSQELRKWLVQILRHRIIDEARRVKLRKKLTESPNANLTVASTGLEMPSALSELVAQETLQTLLTAIECLEAQQQYIVRSRYIDSMTFEEIGQQLDLSHDAVRRQWLKAIQKLGQHLNGKGAS